MSKKSLRCHVEVKINSVSNNAVFVQRRALHIASWTWVYLMSKIPGIQDSLFMFV